MGIQMTFKQLNLKNIMLATVVFIAIVFISHKALNIRTESFVKDKYTNLAKEIQFTTQSYIDAKEESVLFIALSLAHDQRYLNAIASSGETNFELDKFSRKLTAEYPV